MTYQKTRQSHVQTMKKEAANMAQDASAFEPTVELDEETLNQVTGTGSNPPNNPKVGDIWSPSPQPDKAYFGGSPGAYVYTGSQWKNVGPQ